MDIINVKSVSAPSKGKMGQHNTKDLTEISLKLLIQSVPASHVLLLGHNKNP